MDMEDSCEIFVVTYQLDDGTFLKLVMLMMVMFIEIVKILRNSSRFHQIGRNLMNLKCYTGVSFASLGYLHATKQ